MNLKTTALFLLLTGSATLVACEKENEKTAPASDTVQMTATLNSKNEVTPTTSAATGTMTGTYNKTTRELNYTVTYQGMTATSGHFHRGAAGVDGNAFVTYANAGTPPITGTTVLSEADAALLMKGEVYVNLHTTANPKGEIRGQVMTK
ncbi:CHRD domain-containing protein [Hymenobacter glacieicola]|uniref:CHRD domain-containing protein n=1 Tax=Hymenobacter glacieicola TaxID=1562124 RepID=A0ABQ1WHY3_9BACT|nr:CHRD domain-containing protein [Hymenobacter glacieicola]GGG29980.1 CHRD domain-containing protein [Hymenobacter glacieicola]